MRHVNIDQSFSTPAECTGSNGLVFYALQNQFLVLKDATNPLLPIFKICKYAGSSSAITLKEVKKPTDTIFLLYDVLSITPVGLGTNDILLVYAELKKSSASASVWISASISETDGN